MHELAGYVLVALFTLVIVSGVSLLKVKKPSLMRAHKVMAFTSIPLMLLHILTSEEKPPITLTLGATLIGSVYLIASLTTIFPKLRKAIIVFKTLIVITGLATLYVGHENIEHENGIEHVETEEKEDDD